MVIEVSTPETTSLSFSWQRIAWFILLFLYLSTLIFYLFLFFSGKKSSEELLKIEAALQRTEEENILEEKVKHLKQKIDDSYLLLSSHKYPSNIFDLLEKITHPKVWFSSFNYNLEKREIILSGVAEDFKALGQQKQILEKEQRDKNIEGFNLDQLSFSGENERRAKFLLRIVFNPNLLLK